jgi:hypothetical protein
MNSMFIQLKAYSLCTQQRHDPRYYYYHTQIARRPRKDHYDGFRKASPLPWKGWMKFSQQTNKCSEIPLRTGLKNRVSPIYELGETLFFRFI